ncbi:cation:proton antiporter [Micromonospora sp. M12]
MLLAFWGSAIRRAPVSEPLLALLVGVLAGPVLGLINLPAHEASVVTLEVSRILLAISLMAVALRFPLSAYRSVIRPVSLLLTVAMVGMAVVSAGLAWLVLGLPSPWRRCWRLHDADGPGPGIQRRVGRSRRAAATGASAPGDQR